MNDIASIPCEQDKISYISPCQSGVYVIECDNSTVSHDTLSYTTLSAKRRNEAIQSEQIVYVGSAEWLQRRICDHFYGDGAKFTTHHPPVKVLEYKYTESNEEFEERKLAKKLHDPPNVFVFSDQLFDHNGNYHTTL